MPIQVDGKLVSVGSTPDPRNDYNFALASFLSNGSIDASFGNGGSVVTDFSQLENDNSAESVAIQADGRVVAAGWVQLGGSGADIAPALARYNANGSIDTSFGTAGQVSNTALIDNDGGPATVIVQADGKIVLAKNVDTGLVDFAISRFNADGSPDIGFGSDGIVKTDLGRGLQDLLLTMVQQADGKLLLAGSTDGPSSSLFAVVRYRSDGSLDAVFGSGGIATTDFGLTSAVSTALAIQADGKIVAVGTASSGTPEIALARYAP